MPDRPGHRTPTPIYTDQHTNPAITDRVERTRRRLNRPDVHVCQHLANKTTDVAMACAAHPAAGLLCPDCCQAHASRHSFTVEHCCDQCGADDSDGGLMTFAVELHGIARVKNPKRGRAVVVGTVVVVSLGLCTPCFEADRRVAS